MSNTPQETTKQQLVRKISEVRTTMRVTQIMEGVLSKSASADLAINKQIIDECAGLLKEAFALGAVGQVCPTCGGSGRAH